MDLLVTDIFLPDMDGLELIQSVRRFAPTMPIIAVTGAGLGDPGHYLKVARALGADATLQKPCSAQEIVDMARELLAR